MEAFAITVSEPRIHHWISQSYLARFTERGDKKSNLFAIDLAQRKIFTPSPRNVCGKRDFNKVISPDLSPDALETSLNSFETIADRALEEVIENRRAFKPKTWAIVLNFMALLATRNPLMRKRAERIYGRRLVQRLESATDTPEKFAALVSAAQAAGDLNKDIVPDYERHREFLKSRRFKLSFDPGFHVVGEFKTLDKVLSQLATRRWLLLEAASDSGGFITTDRPVTLCHSDGSGPSPHRPLGYATRDTMVLFPLSPQLLAVGTLGGREGITRVSREVVAKANCTMIQHCDKLLFSPHQHFEVRVPGAKEYLVGAQVLDVFKLRLDFDAP